MTLRVAVVYTPEVTRPVASANAYGGDQMNKTNLALKEALQQLGHEVHLIPGDINLLRKLHDENPDVVFTNM